MTINDTSDFAAAADEADALDRLLTAPEGETARHGPDAEGAYWRGLAVSDVAATGTDHRREPNHPVADLMRLVLDGRPAAHPWPDALRAAVRHLLLDELRDPASGLSGPRYATDAGTGFVPALSVTFHVVKCLGGDVPGWPALAAAMAGRIRAALGRGGAEGGTCYRNALKRLDAAAER